MQNLGKLLLLAGIILAAAGLVLYFAGNRLHWFGNLPGDIRIKREHFSIYMPFTTIIFC